MLSYIITIINFIVLHIFKKDKLQFTLSTYMQVSEYQKYHISQLKKLFDKGFHDQLTKTDSQHRFYYPALLKNKFYQEVEAQLSRKRSLKAPQLCWLIMSKAMLGQNYLVLKAQLKQKHGDKWIALVDKWLQVEQNIQKPLNSVLSQCRQQFEKFNQKATKYGYFTMKQVPVYLISTEWLQKFYDSENQGRLLPVDNRNLVRFMKFVDTQPKYAHLNYQVKQNCKQNVDFKIISPESWQFLYKKFGGIEVKRFTTTQNDPTVQINYRKLFVSITEDRYFHITGLEILAPRFSTFKLIFERIKRLVVAYNLLPFDCLNKNIEFIKVKDLSEEEIIDLVQDDQIHHIQDQRFQKLDLEFDIEQAKIYSKNQQIILNILDNKVQPSKKHRNFFSKIPTLKTIITRQKCLNCGSQDDVSLCICKAVHFCSANCQKTHKQHAKECQKIRKQQLKLTKLIADYQVTQRQIKLTQQSILTHGKVGLQNLRNTCYMNSALQCILRVDKLVQYFANNDHITDLNVDNVLGSQGHLACAFGQLVKSYYSTNKRALEPINVLRIIAKNPQFRGYQHQDSQEFLNYFLDKLHQDLNRVKNKPYTEEIESNGRPDQIVSKESWQNYLKRNKSFIQELFTGQYRSQIRCPDCERISITFDPFMSVTLPFPKQEKTTYIKAYILNLNGQYEKVQVNVPPSTRTSDFLLKAFHQNVAAVNIEKKVVKKQWRQDVSISKNFTDQGIVLFYIKEEGWEKQVNLHFVDEKGDITAFNRRLYIKSPQNLEQLKKQIYLHIKTPLQKALKHTFQSDEEYLLYCEQKKVVQIIKPSEQDINFPLPQSIVLKLRFNPEVKFQQKPKLNYSSGSYDIKQSFRTKDYKNGISLHELLENFKIPERLTQENMWYCNKCKDHKMADKMMKLYRLPQNLVMHLKRFNHRNTRYKNLIGVQKIQTGVNLKEIQTINGIDYELIGVVNHFGSMSFGHYTAYVKKDEWLTYDDEKVKRCKLNGDNAYLLFYKRCTEQKNN